MDRFHQNKGGNKSFVLQNQSVQMRAEKPKVSSVTSSRENVFTFISLTRKQWTEHEAHVGRWWTFHTEKCKKTPKTNDWKLQKKKE